MSRDSGQALASLCKWSPAPIQCPQWRENGTEAPDYAGTEGCYGLACPETRYEVAVHIVREFQNADCICKWTSQYTRYSNKASKRLIAWNAKVDCPHLDSSSWWSHDTEKVTRGYEYGHQRGTYNDSSAHWTSKQVLHDWNIRENELEWDAWRKWTPSWAPAELVGTERDWAGLWPVFLLHELGKLALEVQ